MPEDATLLEETQSSPSDTSIGTASTTQPSAGGRNEVWADLMSRYAGVGVLVLLYVTFCVFLPVTFPTLTTVQVTLSNEPVNILIALAVLIPLIVGEFDLSVGYALGFSTVLVAYLTGQHHVGLVWACLAALGFGLALGVVNGVLLVVFRINSFIATLGTGTILGGLILWLTNGNILSNIPAGLGNTFAAEWLSVIPSGLVFVLIIATILYVVHEHTRVGRIATAVGLNAEAARLAGARVNRLKFGSFVLSGLMASGAGILDLANVGSAYPTVGPEFMLPAFAAAFLGASMIVPPFANVRGLIVASLILSVGAVGLGQAGAPMWVQSVFDGGVLIVAVAIGVRRGRA